MGGDRSEACGEGLIHHGTFRVEQQPGPLLAPREASTVGCPPPIWGLWGPSGVCGKCLYCCGVVRAAPQWPSHACAG